MSLYRHHHFNGVETASRLYERLLRPAVPTNRFSSTSPASGRVPAKS